MPVPIIPCETENVKKKILFPRLFRIFADPVDADGRIIADLQAFAAVVAHFVFVEIADLAFQTPDAIAVVQHTLLRFHSFQTPMTVF